MSRLTKGAMGTDNQIDTVLGLRECARSTPAALARLQGIPGATARYRINKVEEEGLVVGYTPVVRPGFFGDAYLIKIRLEPKNYQFKEDLVSTVEGLKGFFEEAIGHAMLSFYQYQDDGVWQVQAVVLVRDADAFTDSLYRRQNIAQESIEVVALDDASGVPTYSQHSILKENQSRGSV
jgi:DNA-binding Lrp family transcriptional regulator